MPDTHSLSATLSQAVWDPASLVTLPGFILCLALAALASVILGQAYIRFGRSMSNRRAFARNFLLVTVTTTLIISIIKSSLALSLGLVGALSIVRFRAAIKEPEELAYLFLAISVGLGLGAGQVVLTLVAFTLILAILALARVARPGPVQPNLFVTVSANAGGGLDAGRVQRLLAEAGLVSVLKRLDVGDTGFEASFLAETRRVEALDRAAALLREASPTVHLTCLDDQGLAN
jgi:hypothetical protein